MFRFLWLATKGYRLRPWRSPFLRWRIETYSGIRADTIGFSTFVRFAWAERRSLWRFLRWAERMASLAG
jgi:hypothetical protein